MASFSPPSLRVNIEGNVHFLSVEYTSTLSDVRKLLSSKQDLTDFRTEDYSFSLNLKDKITDETITMSKLTLNLAEGEQLYVIKHTPTDTNSTNSTSPNTNTTTNTTTDTTTATSPFSVNQPFSFSFTFSKLVTPPWLGGKDGTNESQNEDNNSDHGFISPQHSSHNSHHSEEEGSPHHSEEERSPHHSEVECSPSHNSDTSQRSYSPPINLSGTNNFHDDLINQQLVILDTSKPSSQSVSEPSFSRPKPHPQEIDKGVALLCDALHNIMLDSGFSNRKQSTTTTTDSGGSSSVNRYTYIAPLGPMLPTDMICTVIGPQVIAHASISLPKESQSSEVASCVFALNDFISTSATSDTTTCTREEYSSPSLYNTLKLKQQFRDAIPHRLLTNLRRALELPESGTILCLSHEIKILIMTLLDIKSLLQLSLVNKEFYMLSHDSFLWKQLFIKEFGKKLIQLPDKGEEDTWRQLYITETVNEKKIRQEQLLHHSLWIPPRPVDPFPPFFNIHPPSFGGHFVHDRRPHRRERFNPYIPPPPGPLVNPIRDYQFPVNSFDPFHVNFMSHHFDPSRFFY